MVPVIILANMDGTSMSVIVECIFSSSVKIILTLNEKVYQKTVIECVKELNIFIGLKKTCLGVLDRGDT